MKDKFVIILHIDLQGERPRYEVETDEDNDITQDEICDVLYGIAEALEPEEEETPKPHLYLVKN